MAFVHSRRLRIPTESFHRSAVLVFTELGCLSLRYTVQSHLLTPISGPNYLSLSPLWLRPAPHYMQKYFQWSIILPCESHYPGTVTVLSVGWEAYESPLLNQRTLLSRIARRLLSSSTLPLDFVPWRGPKTSIVSLPCNLLGSPLIVRRNIVEKASYREISPSSAQSVKVQLDGEIRTLAEILVDHSPEHRRIGTAEQQRPLAYGFYFMKENAGTQTTPDTEGRSNTTDVHEVETPLPELPTPESSNHKTSPVELPANEIPPAPTPPVPQPIFQPASPVPLLPTPHPRSPNTRKALPLLAPPPKRRYSGDSSMESGSIEISYVPSHPKDGEERELPTPFRLFAYGGGEDVPAPLRISECSCLCDAAHKLSEWAWVVLRADGWRRTFEDETSSLSWNGCGGALSLARPTGFRNATPFSTLQTLSALYVLLYTSTSISTLYNLRPLPSTSRFWTSANAKAKAYWIEVILKEEDGVATCCIYLSLSHTYCVYSNSKI